MRHRHTHTCTTPTGFPFEKKEKEKKKTVLTGISNGRYHYYYYQCKTAAHCAGQFARAKCVNSCKSHTTREGKQSTSHGGVCAAASISAFFADTSDALRAPTAACTGQPGPHVACTFVQAPHMDGTKRLFACLRTTFCRKKKHLSSHPSAVTTLRLPPTIREERVKKKKGGGDASNTAHFERYRRK